MNTSLNVVLTAGCVTMSIFSSDPQQNFVLVSDIDPISQEMLYRRVFIIRSVGFTWNMGGRPAALISSVRYFSLQCG